ncbi:MAG TPA: serine/threonine-protein kinase [Streptosporangiaceae bacterium]|nr:serine/threonine-protein kinase [Streptosporangiaceae bacterium]
MASAEPAMSGMLPLRESDPREVGGYRLLGRLGEGGQGVVFLALSATGTRAAVKLLPPTTDPQVRSRFLKEVAAAQQVAGFCTAQVLDAGIFERRPFIVSEYVSGPSLVEVIQQYGPRSGAVLERIAVATLTALGAVHAVGMVHRDFKPGNVLLGPDGPVVIDFGLAAVPGMTTTGLSGQVAVGTPAFMSPEQLSGARVTAAADMWAWAVTIAFAGTGELPFRGESLTATAYAILHSEPTVSPLPEPLGSIIHRCLSKNPAARPSAHGALSQLVAAGARPEGPIPPETPAVPVDDEAPSPQPAYAVVPEPRRGSDDGPATARPATAGSQAAHSSTGRARWRWRPVAVLGSVLMLAGLGGAALALARQGTPPARPAGPRPGTNLPPNPETVARDQAVTWIVHQVSRAAYVACDVQVCADLSRAGFPNLLTIGPQSNDPLGVQLVVATAAVRAQFRDRLAVWAPAIIAAFRSGNARVEVRLEYPGGASAYNGAQQAYARARKAADALLLTNNRFTFSAAARADLRNGQIDPRLPELLATMAESHPVQVVDFGDQSPGGGPASLLRSVELATPDTAAHLTSAAFLRWIQRLVHVQRAQYRPSLSQLRLPAGQTVLRIAYRAPSPLNPAG